MRQTRGQSANMAEDSRLGQTITCQDRANAGELSPLNLEQVDWRAKYDAYIELPPGQRRVLDLLVGRFEIKRIASQLEVSNSTVRSHVDSLKRKLGARSLPDLVSIVTIALYENALHG